MSKNMQLPPTEDSYWLTTSPKIQFPALEGDITVDVVVIGGGIAGLTAAHVLKQSGMTVAVLEKHEIASGTTGGTTGKVTSQHGLFYASFTKEFGDAKAQVYANAYNRAMRDIADLISDYKLDCGWTHRDNYVYTTDSAKVAEFQQEANTAAKLGLPASFETTSDLPFDITAAVKFSDQAYFNAAAYTRELAKLVQGNGSYVFEHSQAKHIHEGKPCKVKTSGGRVQANFIVVATKIPPFPLSARFTYASFEYPHTSYIVAGKTSSAIQGMYISPDEGNYSFLPVDNGDERIILVGGENHIPGLGNPEKRYATLAAAANKHFGVQQIDYRWKAMDYMAYDGLPMVGPLYPWSKRMIVVTGFKKWGLSTSMVAAKLVQQWVKGHKTPERSLFYPHRLSAASHAPKRLIQETTKLFR